MLSIPRRFALWNSAPRTIAIPALRSLLSRLFAALCLLVFGSGALVSFVTLPPVDTPISFRAQSIKRLPESAPRKAAVTSQQKGPSAPSISALKVPDVVFSPGSSACVVDQADASSHRASKRGRPSTPAERFLLYVPPLGKEQPPALRDAVAWSSVLNRTLVLPQLLGRHSTHPSSAFGAVVDLSIVEQQVPELSFVEMGAFLSRDVKAERLLLLQTPGVASWFDLNLKFEYLDALGVQWGVGDSTQVANSASRGSGGNASSRALRVELPNYRVESIAGAFGQCPHEVLVFGAFRDALELFRSSPSASSEEMKWRVGGLTVRLGIGTGSR